MIPASLETPEQHLVHEVRFALPLLHDEQACHDFRFPMRAILGLAVLVCVPAVVITEARGRVNDHETVSYPIGYPALVSGSLSPPFGRDIGSLCRVFLNAITLLHGRWTPASYCARSCCKSECMYITRLLSGTRTAATSYDFVDGTTVPICQPPDGLQSETYSDHNQFNSLNF
ncbi:hypothetical protein PybrP1_006927 [[Pythium] brassicae (nom. inval.)]|nr:hypothetical protein PybrP1_006927 [[Pythium] brassicae (nom. inval.)]